ncbi:hypothetical protein [Pedobacter sp. MC2016-24]|uniref:hypothetical protein n=1 Tax=Pedobacter sp. MC2016-24 TaxID=2780090 RepID=UPI0018808D1E|nr:hypothetical protein [Pedobacter sp. MC2016-24]MBE9600758.1 hypothetical protein [Pedobacter sp. MC2016-24]
MPTKKIKKWIFILPCLFLINCNTHGDNKNHSGKKSAQDTVKSPGSEFQGEFSSTVETEETTSGTANITYNFVINSTVAVLTTNTYHEPIRCNGNYKIIEKNSILELYYAGNDKNCKSENANFKIKKENDKYFIKGLGGEATINDWIPCSKSR